VSQLGSIDIDKRAVLVLHYYLDLPMPEVAEILDIPYGTAASRLHRGLEALRESMRGPDGPDPELVTRRAR
jgi:DNA-directed RNA polymerase specialized sigma24 family protein